MATTTTDPTDRLPARETGPILSTTWDRPPGLLGWLSAVSHKAVGRRYVAVAFVFFLVGGVEALLMRWQLSGPQRDVLGAEAYNELFTMHGSTMMYLFAVPFLEGVANYLVPLMVGSRDLPFPRLNAFNFWAYLFGGTLLYSSFLFDAVPTGGWYGYPPLVLESFSPGMGQDFWLIGITLAEISAIGAAIELVVVILKHRAPGMSISRMPLFAWAILVTSVAIAVSFTVLLVGSVLMQLDRSFGTHFFDASLGGDPVLWQHLFWIFGHPEVYIMFLPATGIVSHVVQTFSRRPIVGYNLVALSLVATGALSFGLWVHHMFTVGIPAVTLGVFSAASFVIAVPTGVQIFSWITTIWRGSPQLRVPMLYVIAFLVTFVLGGITGVMVASIPFDLQAHDSYFLVAHFHYVLVGGVVFPALAALHYWWTKVTGYVLHHGLSLASFWLVVVGFNLAFFPMHISGLLGMPRRVYTYRAGQGWDVWNLASSVGAVVIAIGVAATVVNFLWSRRRDEPAPGDPWGGDSLEWSTSSPPPPENFRTLPLVSSRHPRWRAPDGSGTGDGAPPSRHREIVDALAEEPLGWRATLTTTVTDAEPSELTYLPGPSLWPLGAAIGLALAAVGVLTDVGLLVALGAIVGSVAGVGWLGGGERSRHRHTDGYQLAGLPVDVSGSRAVGWWGLLWFLVVAGSGLGTLAYSYFFLSFNAAAWPPGTGELPGSASMAVVGALALATAVAASAATRTVARGRSSPLLAAVGVLALATVAAEIVTIASSPRSLSADAFGSLFFAFHGFGAITAALTAAAALHALASSRFGPGTRLRLLAGNAAGLAWFTAASVAVTGVVVYASPRLTG